MEKKLKGSLTI